MTFLLSLTVFLGFMLGAHCKAEATVRPMPPAVKVEEPQSQGQPRQAEGATFVLVHGAWHGGWCWTKVRDLLQAAGHQVFTPTLTGLGSRSHLLRPETDLDTHIQDVATELDYEDLHEVILVGHSYAGMVISGVAEKSKGRLAQLVYLDAFLPENGKSLTNYWQPKVDEQIVASGRLPLPDWTHKEMFDVKDPKDTAWMRSRLSDQPYKTFTQAVHFSSDNLRNLSRTYILTSTGRIFTEAAARAKQEGFNYHELPSAGHDAMITEPEALAGILLGLVSVTQ